MPDSLVDLGGGVKMLDPSALIGKTEQVNPIDSFTKTLNLVNLVNTIKDQPIESATKAAQLKIAENNVSNIGLNNQMLQAQVESQVSGELREKKKFFIEQTGKAIELFKVDPNLGANALNLVIPGGVSVIPDKDGTFTAQTKGGFKFLIDPNKISDPEKRRTFEGAQKDDFTKSTSLFDAASANYRNIKALAAQKPKDDKAGIRDLSILVNYVKLINPNARVNEDTVDQFDGTEGILGQIGSLAKQAKSGQRLDKDQIENILSGAKIHFQTKLDDAVANGQFFYQGAKIQGLDPRLIIKPVGGLQYEDFLPASDLTDEQLVNRIKRKKQLLGE